MRQHVPRSGGAGFQLLVQGQGVIFSPGEPAEEGTRRAVELGREPLLKLGVGLLEGLHGDGDGLVFPATALQLLLHLLQPGRENGWVTQGLLLASGLVQCPIQPFQLHLELPRLLSGLFQGEGGLGERGLFR